MGEIHNTIDLNEFFNFGNQDPVNRVAYTKEDIEYKIKCIEKMYAIGMDISVDKYGNICGEYKGNPKNDKIDLAIGSHTDSVVDGGQYDGTVGVISGLSVIYNLINNSDKKCDKNIKLIIFGGEESCKYGISCRGSRGLADELTEEQLNKLIDGRSLKEDIDFFRTSIIARLNKLKIGVKYVDKVLTKGECKNFIESHIEQHNSLYKDNIQIGIVDCIAGALRIELKAENKTNTKNIYAFDLFGSLMTMYSYNNNNHVRIASPSTIAGFNCNTPSKGINTIADIAYRLFSLVDYKSYEQGLVIEQLKDVAVLVGKLTNTSLEISKKQSASKNFLTNKINNGKYELYIKGESNHTGTTPMEDRKDASFASDLFGMISNLALGNSLIYNRIKRFKNQQIEKDEITSFINELLGMDLQDEKSDNCFPEKSYTTKRVLNGNKINDLIGNKRFRVVKHPNLKTMDIRIQSGNNVYNMILKVNEIIKRVEKITGVKLKYEVLSKGNPVTLNGDKQKAVNTFNKMGISTKRLDLFAGHDIMYMTNIVDQCMMFVIPSLGGSHNPQESTNEESIINLISGITEYSKKLLYKEEKSFER